MEQVDTLANPRSQIFQSVLAAALLYMIKEDMKRAIQRAMGVSREPATKKGAAERP